MSQGGQDVTPLDMAEIEGRLRSLAPGPLCAGRARPPCRRSSSFSRGSPIRKFSGSPTASNSAAASNFAARLAALTRSIEVVTDGGATRAVAGADNEAGALAVRIDALRFVSTRRRDSCARSTHRVARSAARRSTSAQNLATEARVRPAGRIAQRHLPRRHRRRTISRRDLAGRRAFAPPARRRSLPARAPMSRSRCSRRAIISSARCTFRRHQRMA